MAGDDRQRIDLDGDPARADVLAQHLEALLDDAAQVNLLPVQGDAVVARIRQQRADEQPDALRHADHEIELLARRQVEPVAGTLGDKRRARLREHERLEHLVRGHRGEVLDLHALALDFFDARGQSLDVVLKRRFRAYRCVMPPLLRRATRYLPL